MDEIFSKSKKPYFGEIFRLFPKMKVFLKNSTLSVFDHKDPLTSHKISQKPYETFFRKTVK